MCVEGESRLGEKSVVDHVNILCYPSNGPNPEIITKNIPSNY
jgi:hypothetical protein